jgi:DNA polymerase III delta subunit
MIIRYQLTQSFKPNPAHQIFIISYQDLAIYDILVNNLCQLFNIEEHQHLDILKADDWIGLQNISQNYNLFQVPTCYELTLEKHGLPSKSTPLIQPMKGDIFVFKTQQFKNSTFQEWANHPHVTWVQAYQPSVKDLWRWFYQQFLANQYPMASNVQEWFLQQQGLDLIRCQQAFEKWKLSYPTPSKPLSLSDLPDLFGIPQQDNWQPLIDAWLSNQTSIMHQTFLQAKAEQLDLTLLVWIMGRNLQVAYALQTGNENSTQIYQQYKVWPKLIPTIENWSKKIPTEVLVEALKNIQATDIFIKTGQSHKAWHFIEKTLLCTI